MTNRPSRDGRRAAYWSAAVFSWAAVSSAACEAPTYHRDVRPILDERCNRCHVQGIAPFEPEFSSYDNVVSVGQLIVDEVRFREMPPFAPDNSGDCGAFTFEGDGLWLEEREVDTIVRWFEAGAPAGETRPVSAPAEDGPDPVEGEHLIVQPSQPYDLLPYDENGDTHHRCFLVPQTLVADSFVVGADVGPDLPRAVQHVAVYQTTSTQSVDAANALQDSDPAVGYGCHGGPLVAAELLISWVWGSGRVELPEGTGIPIRAGMPLIIQIDYNAVGLGMRASRDQTAVDLYLADDVEPAMWLSIDAAPFSIPGGHGE